MGLGIVGMTPAAWKKVLNLSKDKEQSRKMAIERWPAHAASFSRVKDEGRAEAALLGLAYLVNMKMADREVVVPQRRLRVVPRAIHTDV
jgi:hypothetical protein